MATKRKIIEMITAMKTVYHYFAKDVDVELLVNTWYLLLKDYSDEEIEQGFYMAFKRCKMAFSPAEVIEVIEDMRNAKETSDEALWAIYRNSLREVLYYLPRINYTFIDTSGISQGEQARAAIDRVWEKLPDEIRNYLADKDELIRNAREMNKEDITWERSRFLKTIPIIRKRQKDMMLLDNLMNMRLSE